MSLVGVTGMTRAALQMFTAVPTFTDEDWRAPSAAAGWSLHDVVTRVGCLLGDLVDAVQDAPLLDAGVDELNDLRVAEPRNQTPTETLAFGRSNRGRVGGLRAARADPLWSATCGDGPLEKVGAAEERP
jgi:hypothetical protein